MEEKEKREFENLEAEVFKALDHQMRRDILRYVGEGRDPTFTGILNAIKIPDSPTLAYHLKSLAPFIEQRKGTYHLTPMGKDAFNLLLKAGTYGIRHDSVHQHLAKLCCGQRSHNIPTVQVARR